MRLMNKSTNKTLIPNLEVADTVWTRMKGLLGRKHLPADRALWIKPCNSVHTFFMNFAIDLVFVDDAMVVKKTYQAVKPGRLVWPVWRASSVIELSEGFLQTNPIRIGEQLHVDHSVP